jgi:4-amino-4-deoxy-L-arabinose transferase-like glycosyltransferase
VNQPTPAIVAQSAVRPLPRWALLLLCLAYAVPGFVGRDPWRNADMAAFGYMRELALGRTPWMNPLLAGMPPDTDGPLPYWLGAWAIQALGGWLPMDVAARLPFAALLAVTLAATWYCMYYLARSPGAQPVAFAFGGEAQPADYARAMADAALLALIACLGLAQLSHEITSHLTQLACTALLFFAAAAMPWRMGGPAAAAAAGLFGLVLSGAPALAALLGLGGAWLVWRERGATLRARAAGAGALLGLVLASAALAWALGLWDWRVVSADDAKEWHSLLRLFTWFSWPAWPLALWTLWRWRHQITSRAWHRHLLLPLWFALVAALATLTTRPADRALLLGLPAFAVLAAFALPTLRRSISALIDWFTLLFFSISAIAIWVIWVAVQTGVPAKPAANVAKLAPGYAPAFSLLAFGVALAATLAWCALVWWRAARNRAAIWKSLVLPASGATLGWLLLMTLWLPLLDYGRSFAPQVARVTAALDAAGARSCVAGYGLSRAQTAALAFHGGLDMVAPAQAQACGWVVADAAAEPPVRAVLPPGQWRKVASATRPTERTDRLLILQRITD